MNLLYIHQYFTTPARGGGTRSFEFARRFCEAGHKVTVITGSTDLPTLPSESIEGLRIVSTNTAYANSMSFSRRKFQFAKFAIHSALMNLPGIDIVLATSTPLTVAIPGLAFKFRKKVPLIFEVRDLWPEAPVQLGALTNPFLIKLLRRFESYVYHNSNHIVALSPGMVEGVAKCGVPPHKITLIPNSCDLGLFNPGPIEDRFLRRYGLPVKPTIAYTGALGEANDIPLLIAAAKKLQHISSKVQIVVAGEGKYRTEIENAAITCGNLRFIGKVSKIEVAELYKASHAGLVLFKRIPILQTNSPNKFFDLLAAGRPVITNMTGWIGDLVRTYNVGMTTDDTADSLAHAIDSIAKTAPTQIEAICANSRKLAESQFSRDMLANEYLTLFRKVQSKPAH